ncbi:MAG: conserved rane protein of unknown function [Blastococcus sp.]|jgi:hypothetical protein|nr:conserved rane protein of unknown function [Blastococcus sp.]
MSSPTPGSDPNYPQGRAPEDQPGWGAPQPAQGYNPAPSSSGPPAGYGAAGNQRPSQVTAAAIIGIVIGGIGSLFGLIGLFAIGIVFDFNLILGLLYLVSIATAVVVLIGGIQAIQGKSPRLLLLGSYASIGVQLLYLIFSVASGYGFSFSALVGFVLPGIIVFLLMQPQAKQFYASRGISY